MADKKHHTSCLKRAKMNLNVIPERMNDRGYGTQQGRDSRHVIMSFFFQKRKIVFLFIFFLRILFNLVQAKVTEFFLRLTWWMGIAQARTKKNLYRKNRHPFILYQETQEKGALVICKTAEGKVEVE